jgi:hypothetical protein
VIKSDVIAKVEQINSLMEQVRQYKDEHPESITPHWNHPGSILNAYREGDLAFDQAVAALTPPQAEEAALDLVAKLLEEMGNTGLMEKAWGSEQTAVWLRRLDAHPEYIAAKARKQKKYCDHLRRVAAEVSLWPSWKRGV